MDKVRNRKTIWIAVIGSILVLAIMIICTIWTTKSTARDTQESVRAVSMFYLQELAGRREQVVENNLQNRIRDLQTAVDLMTEEDLSDKSHLEAYQSHMKRLYVLEKFAFVDTNGLIYTAQGVQTNIDEYSFDYKTISGPDISIFNLNTPDKRAVIAVPVDKVLRDTGAEAKAAAAEIGAKASDDGSAQLKVCFMEIDMEELLTGVSMKPTEGDATFCNLYTKNGIALTDTILGGLAVEDNLLAAMKNADYEGSGNYDSFVKEFQSDASGETSFTYGGIYETLSYVPVKGTDWVLTYLIRESVVSDRISTISEKMAKRMITLSVLMVIMLLAIFALIILQEMRNMKTAVARETADAELRGKQEELERRIALQGKLEEQSQALSDALSAAEQANRAKTTFLSNMSHEIRTPMNAIIGLDNIALNDPETPEKTKEYLVKIGDSAGHLLNLINDILDMSRIESGRMTLKNEEFSFPKLLETINTMFSGQAHDKGVRYECHLRSEVSDYYVGDNMKLRQVLINILGNAVKFTPEGGKVELTVEEKASFGGKSTLEFTISDTGIGMSEDFLPHIFDSFAQEDASSTNKYGSSGLGMAITKNIVEMMNGDIEVTSEKGKGTTFVVTVTLTECDRQEAEEIDIQPGEMTVLVVDDSPIDCEHASLVLEKAGISAEIAASGEEAIEMVKVRNARRDPYNLILVDWKMPGMDGVEATKRMREIIGHDTAIIILTAYRWDDVLEEARSAGVDRFISKPLFINSVLEEFAAAARSKNIKGLKEKSKAELTGRRVLIAEDVDVNAEILKMTLQMRQIESDRAENGRIVCDMFAAKPAGYYDAILMDMRMPEMDGLEATETIRAMDRSDAKEIPIIALTANAFDEDVQRSLQAGLNAHLSKPVQPDVLFDALESLIK